ncbi:hypothetical protein LCGC14_0535570 [marine sediment metagenome]|uniref:Uncharacterized protein n=1 Tax=marine sediment metagenome TaxID=412755 RepID=A0A0F9V2I0_9ZZZZ
MKTYKELVRECPELGEAFAEFENRISYLENSQPYHQEAATIQSQNENPTLKEAAEPWASKQWDVINQLRAMVLYLQEKVNKSTDKKKRTKLTIK